MTREEYIKLLNSHDWTYQYSDDNRHYWKGEAEASKLKALTINNEEFSKLYKEKRKEVFGGGAN